MPNPIENDQLPPVVEPPVTEVPAKPKRKTALLLLISVLVLGGGAAGYFVWNHKKSSTKTTVSNSANDQAASGNQTTISLKKAPATGSYLFREQTTNASVSDPTIASLVAIDPLTGLRSALYTKKELGTNTQILGYVKVGSTSRIFTQSDRTDGDKRTIELAYQDDGGTPKVIYTLASTTSPTAGTGYYNVYAGFSGSSIAADGSNIDFYETKDANERAIKRVDISGKVTVLASTTSADTTAPWGLAGFANIIPYTRSKDGKTLYFDSYNCLQCDGGAHADIVALDIASKKFSMPFADPVSGTGGGFKRVNEDTFVVTASNRPGLGTMSYEQAMKDKDYLYLYNATTASTKKIFETSAKENEAQLLGASQDGKKVYVSISNYTQGTLLLDEKDATQGHNYSLTTKEIREYDTASGAFTVVSVPVDFSKEMITSMNGRDGSFVIEVNQAESSIYDQTAVINYQALLKKGDTKVTKLDLLTSPKGFSSFFGFN